MSYFNIIVDGIWRATDKINFTALLFTTFTICITAFILHPAISQGGTKLLEDEDIILEEDLHLPYDNDMQTSEKHILSLVIPAYNEQERLPPTLLSILLHLKESKEEITRFCQEIIKFPDQKSTTWTPFEIIVINDGSKDNTVKAVKNLFHNEFKTVDLNGIISIRLLTLTKNCGKGAAVKVGMLHTNGQLCLMLDADNATNFQPSLLKLLEQMKQINNINNSKNNNMIVFGSRAHLQEDSKAKRSFMRTILMVAFHFFVKTLCSNSIHDTQCGFKLFSQDAALTIFQNLHLTRWAFDTEVVVIAEKLGMSIAEVGVEWEEVDGSKLATSKLALFIASVEMLRDMVCVRVMYSLGLWRLRQSHNKHNTRKI